MSTHRPDWADALPIRAISRRVVEQAVQPESDHEGGGAAATTSRDYGVDGPADATLTDATPDEAEDEVADWAKQWLDLSEPEPPDPTEPDEHPFDPLAWPYNLPPVAQLLREGLNPGRATVLVGENGTGKSTIIEAIAMAYGLGAEGGSTGAILHHTRPTESPLWQHLAIERGPGASRWGYFVRAETLHGLFTYLAENPGAGDEPEFHNLSHGQSVLALMASSRFSGKGLFVLDEPEAGLSLTSQLQLLDQLTNITERTGRQVIMATHSPILAGLPGADLYECSADGLTQRAFDDLHLVQAWRRALK